MQWIRLTKLMKTTWSTTKALHFFIDKKGTLNKLQSHAGCVQIKSLCVENLHVEAHSAEENALLAEFFNEAQEVGWNLIEDTNYWIF